MSNSEADLPDNEVVASFREIREYARGDLDVDHSDVYQWTGLVDDPLVREVLAFMAANYDPDLFDDLEEADLDGEMPRSFEDTEFFEQALRKWGTERATEAIAEGNVSQTVYITGLPSYKSDISGLHAINQLADWLVHSEQCKLIYLAALMGRGKTDLSLTLLEIVADHYDRLERADVDDSTPTPEFAANFRVSTPTDAPEVRHIDNFDRLEEWGRRGSSDLVRWFIFDEASTELTAQSGSNAQDVAEVMAPFVKKMRKMGINMIVIGHDKRDVHPAIRSLADFVDKTGLKTASFYAGIKRREPTGHLFDVSGIPPTSWEFDTDDTADWSWGSALEEGDPTVDVDAEIREFRNERIARLYAQIDSLTYEDLGTAFDVSRETVRRAVKNTEIEQIEVKT